MQRLFSTLFLCMAICMPLFPKSYERILMKFFERQVVDQERNLFLVKVQSFLANLQNYLWFSAVSRCWPWLRRHCCCVVPGGRWRRLVVAEVERWLSWSRSWASFAAWWKDCPRRPTNSRRRCTAWSHCQLRLMPLVLPVLEVGQRFHDIISNAVRGWDTPEKTHLKPWWRTHRKHNLVIELFSITDYFFGYILNLYNPWL